MVVIDLVGTVSQVITQIQGTIDQVNQNKDDCEALMRLTETMGSTLQQIEATQRSLARSSSSSTDQQGGTAVSLELLRQSLSFARSEAEAITKEQRKRKKKGKLTATLGALSDAVKASEQGRRLKKARERVDHAFQQFHMQVSFHTLGEVQRLTMGTPGSSARSSSFADPNVDLITFGHDISRSASLSQGPALLTGGPSSARPLALPSSHSVSGTNLTNGPVAGSTRSSTVYSTAPQSAPQSLYPPVPFPTSSTLPQFPSHGSIDQRVVQGGKPIGQPVSHPSVLDHSKSMPRMATPLLGKQQLVPCPTCKQHLEVALPASGSQTLTCGVCRHLFHASADGTTRALVYWEMVQPAGQ